MRNRPEVCFEVEQIQDLSHWKSVIASGHFEELHGETAAMAMSLLVNRLLPLISSTKDPAKDIHSVTPHGDADVGSQTVVYCLHLSEKSGRFETG